MVDYLRDFSGSYQDKVSALMRMIKEQTIDIPYGKDELKDIKSRNEMRAHYDHTNTRLKWRINATVKYRQEVHKRLQGVLAPREIDGLFAYSNSMILRGGYDAADHNRMITLAAAIWILDQLNLQGDLLKAYPYIPEMDDGEVLCPYVMHPQYDYELVCGVVKLLLYRNSDSYGGLGEHEATLVSETSKHGALRGYFDAIMNLLDPSAVDNAIKKYEEKVWEFYGLSLPAAAKFDKAEERIMQEIEDMEKQNTPAAVPLCMVRPDITKLTEKNPKIERLEILRRKLKRYAYTAIFTEMGLANSREKTVKAFGDILGEQLARQIIDFSVDDPFEMAFALFYLLDAGSDIPWLYYGSICVTYTLVDQLPFDTSLVKPGERELHPDLTRSLYTHRFSGYRWDEAQDCTLQPVQRDKATNLAQLLYENAYAVYPRVTGTLPQLEQYFADMDLKDESQKEAYQLLLYLLRSGNDRCESLAAYRLCTQSENNQPSIPVDTEDTQHLQAHIKELSRQASTLRTAAYEENRSKRIAEQNLRKAQAEVACQRREVADLRQLVFSQQQEFVEECTEETAIPFPVKLPGRIVSVGGHPNWIREMKTLLPNIAYFSAEVIPNKDILRNAHEVWVQTQYISHAAFYRIEAALGEKTQLRFFTNQNARRCAEKIVLSMKGTGGKYE
jgi:hypothetical protein